MTHRARTITPWKRGPIILVAFALAIQVAGADAQDINAHHSPPVAPVRPVTDDYYGTKIVDNYRYMENLKDPGVQQWMKAQADYTHAMLDSLPGRAALLARINDVIRSQPARVLDDRSSRVITIASGRPQARKLQDFTCAMA